MAFKPSFSLVFLATATLLFAANATPRNLGEFKDLCRRADFKDLCEETIQGETDPIAATEKSINELITKTEKARSKDRAVSKQPKLSGCRHNYDAAITDLNRALESMKQKNQQEVITYLGLALEDYGDCDDMVVDGPSKSSMGLDNKALNQMTSNCLALANMIKF